MLSTIVQAALLIKCPLFILRLISPRVFLPQACHNTNKTKEAVEQHYIFTMVVYTLLFIGRWIEAIVLHIQLYKFF